MRTTIDIEDDVLLAAKERAAREKISLGQALTALARAGLSSPATPAGKTARLRGRLALLPRRKEIVTLAHVRKVADEEGV
jgi:hypothetical protein